MRLHAWMCDRCGATDERPEEIWFADGAPAGWGELVGDESVGHVCAGCVTPSDVFVDDRKGSEFVWGIDPALSRIAFAVADTASESVEVETLVTRTEATEGERLGLLDRQVRIAARQMADRFPPAVCWVEQPSGRHRALQLTYCTGVVQAALFETLGVPVWSIPSSAWKCRALGEGRGNASKAQIAAWARQLGYEFGSQDECDAIGIAVAGRSMLLTGRWDGGVDRAAA